MSTQDGSSVPFFYDHEQRGFRLLELPPELLELITSDRPPCLKLKSAANDTQTGSLSDQVHAVLCTKGKTYQLRQVQTSNTVLVTELHGDESIEDSPPVLALSAVATCSSSLEVLLEVPIQAPTGSKVRTLSAWLRELPSVYSTRDDLDGNVVCKSKASIFCDVPYSNEECEEAWTTEVAFEHDGNSWLPAASVLLDLWNVFSEHMIEQSGSLLGSVDVQTVKDFLDELEAPEELVDAFLSCVFRVERQDLQGPSMITLDQTRTVDMIGQACVTISITSNHGAAVWNVLEMWKKALPGQWTEGLTTKDVMEIRTKLKPTITGRTEEDAIKTEDDGKDKKRASTGRDWHAKFKRTKR